MNAEAERCEQTFAADVGGYLLLLCQLEEEQADVQQMFTGPFCTSTLTRICAR